MMTREMQDHCHFGGCVLAALAVLAGFVLAIHLADQPPSSHADRSAPPHKTQFSARQTHR